MYWLAGEDGEKGRKLTPGRFGSCKEGATTARGLLVGLFCDRPEVDDARSAGSD